MKRMFKAATLCALCAALVALAFGSAARADEADGDYLAPMSDWDVVGGDDGEDASADGYATGDMATMSAPVLTSAPVPPPPVPLPPSAAMLLAGLVGVGGIGWMRRRR